MNTLQHIEVAPNTHGKDYVIGDIHGMYKEVLECLDEVSFDRRVDRLFCVGDLIDRGYDNPSCLALTKEPWFFSVRGNHESLFIEAFEETDDYYEHRWHSNGGLWAGEHTALEVQEFYNIVTKLPYFYTIKHSSGKRIGICHAQPPTEDWEDVYSTLGHKQLNRAVWGRTAAHFAPEGYMVKNIDLTVHGHCILPEVRKVGNSLFIDTGGFLAQPSWQSNGYMTILCLDDLIGEEDE